MKIDDLIKKEHQMVVFHQNDILIPNE